MKKIIFTFIMAFTVIFTGCKHNIVQSAKDNDNIEGYAKVCVSFADSDRKAYPQDRELRQNLYDATYELFCDKQIMNLDKSLKAYIPYGNHTFLLNIYSVSGKLIFKGEKNLNITSKTSNLTFYLSDSIVNGSIDYYIALFKNRSEGRVSPEYPFYKNIKASLVNLDSPNSDAIKSAIIKEIPLNLNYDNGVYYLEEIIFEDIKDGSYLLNIKGDVYYHIEYGQNGPEDELQCKDLTFYTDEVVVTKGLVSSNKDSIYYFNLNTTPNEYKINYVDVTEDDLLDLPSYYARGEELFIPTYFDTDDRTFTGFFFDSDFTKRLLNNKQEFVNRIGNVTLYPKYMNNRPLVLYSKQDNKIDFSKISSIPRYGDNYPLGKSYYDFCLSVDSKGEMDGFYQLYEETNTTTWNDYLKIQLFDSNSNTVGDEFIVYKLTDDWDPNNSSFYFDVDNYSENKTFAVYLNEACYNNQTYKYTYNEYFEIDDLISSRQPTHLIIEKNNLYNKLTSSYIFEEVTNTADYIYIDSFVLYNNILYVSINEMYWDAKDRMYKYNCHLVKIELNDTAADGYEVEALWKSDEYKINDMIIIPDSNNEPHLYVAFGPFTNSLFNHSGYISEFNIVNNTFGDKIGLTDNYVDISGINSTDNFPSKIKRPVNTTTKEFFGADRFIAVEPKKLFIADSGVFYWDVSGFIEYTSPSYVGEGVKVSRIVEYNLEEKTLDVFDTDAPFIVNADSANNFSFTSKIDGNNFSAGSFYYDINFISE